MSIELVTLSNHFMLCHPLLLLPSIFPSIRVFSNESALHIKWPKYWSFSFSISPSIEYSGLISFRIDRFALLAVQFSSVQFIHSVVSDSLQPHELQHSRPPCPSPTPGVYPNSCPLSQWCHPIISSSVFPFSSHLQSIRVFSSESGVHIRWPKHWSFSFNISPSNEHPGPTSLRMDWLDLLAVQGTLESLLQHHNSKASILLRSALFIVQLTSIHDHWKNP